MNLFINVITKLSALAAFVSSIFVETLTQALEQTSLRPSAEPPPTSLKPPLPLTLHPTVSIFVSHRGLLARLGAFLSVRQTNMAALTSLLSHSPFPATAYGERDDG